MSPISGYPLCHHTVHHMVANGGGGPLNSSVEAAASISPYLSTSKNNTTQHNTTQHNTTQHNTTQHNTTQHNTILNNTILYPTIPNNTQQYYTQQYLAKSRNKYKTSNNSRIISLHTYYTIYLNVWNSIVK